MFLASPKSVWLLGLFCFCESNLCVFFVCCLLALCVLTSFSLFSHSLSSCIRSLAHFVRIRIYVLYSIRPITLVTYKAIFDIQRCRFVGVSAPRISVCAVRAIVPVHTASAMRTRANNETACWIERFKYSVRVIVALALLLAWYMNVRVCSGVAEPVFAAVVRVFVHFFAREHIHTI